MEALPSLLLRELFKRIGVLAGQILKGLNGHRLRRRPGVQRSWGGPN
jgi:hypothetical protein